jgi:hypothetical protein
VVGVIVMVPLSGCEPLHAPLAIHVVLAVADHVRVVDRPTMTLVELRLIEIDVGVIEAGAW